MLAEVKDGYVDASIGGFSTNLERFELVEFSQSLVTAIIALTMKTPDKSDQVSHSSRKNSRFRMMITISIYIYQQLSYILHGSSFL